MKLCTFTYQDKTITVYKKGEIHQVFDDGYHWMDIYLDEQLVWCEVQEGSTKEAKALGERIEKEMM